MLKLRKTAPGEPLMVSMTALRLGDRVLVLGGADPSSIALFAGKPGLTGRMCLVDEDAARTARAAQVAEREGALVESATAPLTQLPYSAGEFDVVIGSHMFALVPMDRRIAVLGEANRVVRSGGRCILIERHAGVLGAVIGRPGVPASELESALSAAGFSGARTLAQRNGLTFVEAARKG